MIVVEVPELQRLTASTLELISNHLYQGTSEDFGLSFIAELDYGLVTILCKGSEQCELSGVVKGISLGLRVDSFVWSQDCCDLRCGRLDDTLCIGYVSSWK